MSGTEAVPSNIFDRWIFRHINQSTNQLIRGPFLEVLWPSVLGTGSGQRSLELGPLQDQPHVCLYVTDPSSFHSTGMREKDESQTMNITQLEVTKNQVRHNAHLKSLSG